MCNKYLVSFLFKKFGQILLAIENLQKLLDFLIGIAFWLYFFSRYSFLALFSLKVNTVNVFVCQICGVAKVVLIHMKDLDKFGYKLKSEIKILKHPLYFWLLYLNHV
jgi:hypothetical protein